MNSTTKLIASIVILLVIVVSLGAIAVATIGAISPILGIGVVALLILGGLYVMPWVVGRVPLDEDSDDREPGTGRSDEGDQIS